MGMPKGALSSTAWGEGGCSHNSLLSCFNSVAKDYASAAKLCRCKACVYAMPKLGGGGGGRAAHLQVGNKFLSPAACKPSTTPLHPKVLPCGFPKHPPSLHLCMLLLLKQELFVFSAFSRWCSPFISLWHLSASCRCSHVHIWERIF